MKTMKCYDCEQTFQAPTSEAMLNHFYTHYMSEHHAIITGVDETEKKRWMQQFNADWESATQEKPYS